MSSIEFNPQEVDVADLALRALNAAYRRALKAGRTVVVVENGELVRIGPSGRTVLKKLAPRRKVSVRWKRASS